MNRIETIIEATVNPTEDLSKIERALRIIVKGGSLEKSELRKGYYLVRIKVNNLDSLAPFQRILKLDRIRSAARRILVSSIADNSIQFSLNKQALCANHVSFAQRDVESPLGPVTIKILSDNPEAVVDWIAPGQNRSSQTE